MLKSGGQNLVNLLFVVFNKLYTAGYFPDTWASNILSPLHKKGDKTDPNNYRAIAIGSNLAKLYCSILQGRLAKFSEGRGLVPDCHMSGR